MSEHKFKMGQALNFTPHRISFGAGPSKCKVVRLLATDGDDPQYRIKCTTESFERVVRESELG
jgi:hypothetical protein